MVEIKFYESVTARKQGVVFGVFNIPINPEEVPATSEKLKGKFTTSGKDMYELAEACRTKRVEKAVFECKEQAIDRVRAYIPEHGVVVASLIEKTEDSRRDEEVINWIMEHDTLTEDFKTKFPDLYEKYKEEPDEKQ